MKKLLQIVTVSFAVGMLGVYVVHSQLEQNRAVAPTSKSGAIFVPATQAGTTNASFVITNVHSATSHVYFSGSKSLVPVVQFPAPAPAPALTIDGAPSNATPAKFFPGSKSSPVMTPDDLAQLMQSATPVESPKSDTNSPAVKP